MERVRRKFGVHASPAKRHRKGYASDVAVRVATWTAPNSSGGETIRRDASARHAVALPVLHKKCAKADYFDSALCAQIFKPA
jgi:hypothetical protein